MQLAWKNAEGEPSEAHVTRNGVETICGRQFAVMLEQGMITPNQGLKSRPYRRQCPICYGESLRHERYYWFDWSVLQKVEAEVPVE